MSGKSALIIGATGQTGRYVLSELLSNPTFSRVGEYGRRVTPHDAPTLQRSGVDLSKLEQKEVDFENLAASGMKQGKWDVVYITLGTTRANAGSAEAFVKIDREYVVNAAKEAKSDDPSFQQRVVYVSSGGSNAKSPFLYMKSKGLTEQALGSLGYSDSIIFKPGFLSGTNRSDSRIAESVASPIVGFLGRFSSNIEIQITTLAKAVVKAGELGSSALPASAEATKEGNNTVIANKGALALGKSSS